MHSSAIEFRLNPVDDGVEFGSHFACRLPGRLWSHLQHGLPSMKPPDMMFQYQTGSSKGILSELG